MDVSGISMRAMYQDFTGLYMTGRMMSLLLYDDVEDLICGLIRVKGVPKRTNFTSCECVVEGTWTNTFVKFIKITLPLMMKIPTWLRILQNILKGVRSLILTKGDLFILQTQKVLAYLIWRELRSLLSLWILCSASYKTRILSNSFIKRLTERVVFEVDSKGI